MVVEWCYCGCEAVGAVGNGETEVLQEVNDTRFATAAATTTEGYWCIFRVWRLLVYMGNWCIFEIVVYHILVYIKEYIYIGVYLCI